MLAHSQRTRRPSDKNAMSVAADNTNQIISGANILGCTVNGWTIMMSPKTTVVMKAAAPNSSLIARIPLLASIAAVHVVSK